MSFHMHTYLYIYTYTYTYSPLYCSVSPDLCVCICVYPGPCLYACVILPIYVSIHTPTSIYAPSHVVHTHTRIFSFSIFYVRVLLLVSIYIYICVYVLFCSSWFFPKLCNYDPSFPSHRVTPGLCRPCSRPIIVWAFFLEPRPPVCEGVRILTCFIHWVGKPASWVVSWFVRDQTEI